MTPEERFVLTDAGRCDSRVVAHIVGKPVEWVRNLRNRSGLRTTSHVLAEVNIPRSFQFAELFAKWHGRPPVDADWAPPQKFNNGGGYVWLPPEQALLLSLVGTMGVSEIQQVLSERLRRVTGDPSAVRTRNAVLCELHKSGMLVGDVIGGIKVTDAAKQIGTAVPIYTAIKSGGLSSRRTGRYLVISIPDWEAWKAKIQPEPAGCVPLASLRRPLGFSGDKLAEYAKAGYVPGAFLYLKYPTGPTAKPGAGTWYVESSVADQLLADRRNARPMPWFGKPSASNLRATWKMLKLRRHPATCRDCQLIWKKAGAPSAYEDFVDRYPALTLGAKRHLSRRWTPGLAVDQVATKAGVASSRVRSAIKQGTLASSHHEGVPYITGADAARWVARNCPTGSSEKSWISVANAPAVYGFTREEIDSAIASGRLQHKVGTAGAMRGVRYVLRYQCAEWRDTVGFSSEEAARRIGVTVEHLNELLEGLQWRPMAGISLTVLSSVVKRRNAERGMTIPDAADLLAVPESWIWSRVNDGTVRLSNSRWTRAGHLLNGSMMLRLNRALEEHGVDETPPPSPVLTDHIRLNAAAMLAGVSTTTVLNWKDEGLTCFVNARGNWFRPDDIKHWARKFHAHSRYRRDMRPEWLVRETREGDGRLAPASAYLPSPGVATVGARRP